MSWAKFDDSYTENRKVRSVSAMAQHLHMFAIIHCAKGETDGFFPKYDLPLVASKARIKTPAGPMQELVDARLMHDHGDRYEVHDFLDYNPSHAELEAKRQEGAKRVSNWRRNGRRNKGSNGTCNGVTPLVTNSVANGVSNERPDPGTLSLGSDPSVLEADPDQSNPRAKSAHDWLTYYNARYFNTRGKNRGSASDAKATADLQGALDGQSEQERAEDWSNRQRIADEFLARTDARTVQAGHCFAFFVQAFDALRVEPARRPSVRADGREGPRPVHWGRL